MATGDMTDVFTASVLVGRLKARDREIARLTAENEALRARLETVEAETRERCAKVADYGVQRAHRDWHDRKKAEGAHSMAEELAAAIRNLEPRHD